MYISDLSLICRNCSETQFATMKIRSTTLNVLIFLGSLLQRFSSAQSPTKNVSHFWSLYDEMFRGYNKNILPLANYTDVVIVETAVAIISINNFDEMSGELDLTMVFFATWFEKRITWDPLAYGGIDSILVGNDDIWHPQLIILQSFGKLQDIGSNSIMPRVYANGTVSWNPGAVIKVSCSVDVTYFPFDVQKCVITLSGWSYDGDEVYMYAGLDKIDTSWYSENSQWELKDTNVSSAQFGPDFLYLSTIRIELTLTRRSQFFIVYILVPLVFLGLINHMVFAMPVSSGERMSVSVTTFLSFIVYLEMINANLPQSSSPMAYLYIYVLFLLVYSSTVNALCLISLIIHGKQGPVPDNLKSAVICLRCWCCRHSARGGKTSPDGYSDNKKQPYQHQDDETNPLTITWTEVGNTYDRWVSFILFITFSATTCVIFAKLYLNQGL